MSTDEKYLNPKELSAAMLERYGLGMTEDYVRAIRQESERRGDGVFVARFARPSELLKWLRENPTFTRRSARARRKCSAGFSV